MSGWSDNCCLSIVSLKKVVASADQTLSQMFLQWLKSGGYQFIDNKPEQRSSSSTEIAPARNVLWRVWKEEL